MPDTPLLTDPLILQGLINEMQPPEEFRGLAMLGGGEDYPFPTFAEEVISSTRYVAAPNVPNAEAQIIGHQGVGEVSGKFWYTRLKKVLEGTTIKWLRTPGEYARKRAEAKIAEELADMLLMVDRFKEWAFWQIMLTGTLTLKINGAEITINWGLPANATPTAAVGWTTDAGGDGYTDAEIIDDLTAWRQVVLDNGNVAPTEIWCNSLTLRTLYKNNRLKDFFTDRVKDQVLNTGSIGPILGYTWNTYDLTYQNAAGTSTPYIPEGKLIMRAPQDQIRQYNGPSPDTEAPDNTHGRFGKAWHSKDPSGYTMLAEDTFFVHLRRPKQLLIADVYTP